MATITHTDDAATSDAEMVLSLVPAVVCFWSWRQSGPGRLVSAMRD
ncbi:MAG: hypothetical protein ACLP5O_03400 [Acidimicrobiales bacterium]